MRLTLVAPLMFLAWCGWMLLTLQASRQEDAGRAVVIVKLEGIEKTLLDLQHGSIVLWRYPVVSDSVDRWRDLYRNYRAQVQQLEGKDPVVRDVMDNLLRLYAAVGRTERIRQQLLTAKVPEEEARALETEFRARIDVALAEVKGALLKVRTPNPSGSDLRLWTVFAITAAIMAVGTAFLLWFLGNRMGHAQAAEADLAANRRDVQAVESRSQSILDAAPDAFLVTDDRGIVLAANLGVQNLTGSPATDLVGRSLSFLLPALTRRKGTGGPDDPESGWVKIETRRRDGESIVLDAIMRKTAIDGEPAMLTVLRPAGKGRVDAALRDERDFLNSVFESVDLMLAVLDERGRVVGVNGALERKTGLTFGQLQGRLLQEALQIEPLAGSPSAFPALKGLTWLTQPEERRRIAWKGAELIGKGGAVTHIIALGVDLTDYLGALAPAVPAAGELGQLAAKVSQTLGDALTTITGYSEMLLDSLGPEDAARQDLEEILAAGRRASAVTGRLLLFSQRQALRPQEVHLNARIDALKARLCLALGPRVTLSIEPDENLGPVFIDPDRFDDTLLILARNAGEAMPQGGKVTIHTENAHIAEGSVWVAVSLRDTGTGIDAETHKRLFEPFFTTKDPRKALGLGLATVREIVSQSGGRVQIETAPGAGTNFSILLPPAEAGVIGAHA
jgi:PAS domain S-box-containing protein